MGELADILEGMAKAGLPGHRLRALVDLWTHHERVARAARRPEEPPQRLIRPGDPAEYTHQFILVAEPPTAPHVEALSGDWTPRGNWGGYHPAAALALGSLIAAPLPLGAALTLEVAGKDEVGGSPTVRLRGRLRHHTAGSPPFGLHEEPAEYLLDVDAGRGILRRFAERLEGADVRVISVRPFADAEPLPVPPPRAPVEAPQVSAPMQLSVDEAARRAPFRIVRPRRAPEGAALWTELHGDVLRMVLSRDDARFAVHLEQRALTEECDEDLERWESIVTERGGLYCWTAQHPDPRYTEEHILVDREGTRVTLRARLPRAMLVEIAQSLEVVSAGDRTAPRHRPP
jgi:hypothetical protein